MCVHELVGIQAHALADAVAVTDGDRKLTYGEMNARANQLANLLRSLGVRAEVPVALFLERSPELPTAALAVLKAGGAYVPLDPGYPSARIAMLLQDSGAPVVLTHSSLANKLPSGSWKKIVIDSTEAEIFRHSTAAPNIKTNPEDCAYVIFTSGSTGRPKGVQITHANLLNLVRWHQRAFNITAADRATLQASPGFDASVWEMWPYLTAGASVHIVDDSIRTAPDLLRDWMVANGITVSFVPTAVAEQMIDLPWPTQTSLRVLLTGADCLRRYPPRGLPFALINNYGPTECTVVATSGEIGPNHQTDDAPSIGRPVDNVDVYIVDEESKPVADGVPGELLIGGAGVGRGYLNLPELTAQKFIADPFNSAAGARLYRSGDLACKLPDGRIAFVGRMDEQIKIRGYRIEPGEISTALNRHPAISSSCVAAYADDSGESRLAAYIVPQPNAPLASAQLQSFLGEFLPEYMVPAIFVKLERIPLTPNGKADRSALPRPTADNTLDDAPFAPPQSEIEQWLAGFLTGLLKVDRVSRDDNFFNLGGHSLMGAQLIAKVHQRFAVELSLRSLFDHPTIAEISAEIERLLFAKVETMTDEEAQRLLESLPGIPA
ncbi:MAG: amino acid adenylation domain-containing protein [Candidatus Sulfotelmatobacter sp.]